MTLIVSAHSNIDGVDQHFLPAELKPGDSFQLQWPKTGVKLTIARLSFNEIEVIVHSDSRPLLEYSCPEAELAKESGGWWDWPKHWFNGTERTRLYQWYLDGKRSEHYLDPHHPEG